MARTLHHLRPDLPSDASGGDISRQKMAEAILIFCPQISRGEAEGRGAAPLCDAIRKEMTSCA